MKPDPISEVIERFSNTVGKYGGAAVLTILIGVMTYEVIARHLFNSPTRWALEYSAFLQVILVAVTASYILNEDGHVHIDLLTEMMPKVWQHRLHAVGAALGALFCVFLAAQMWTAAAWAWKVNTASDTMGVPIAPIQFVLFGGLALLAVQFAVRCIKFSRLAAAARSGHVRDDESPTRTAQGAPFDG